MRGFCKLDSKDVEGALSDFNSAIEKNPKLASAFYHRGDARFRSNNYLGASQDYTEAVTLGLTDPVLFNNRGKAFFNQDQYDKAIDDFGMAIAIKKVKIMCAPAMKTVPNTYLKIKKCDPRR